MPSHEKPGGDVDSIDIEDLDGGHLRVMGIVSETVRRAAVVHV